MASLGHIAVGMAAARLYVRGIPEDRRPPLAWTMVALSALSLSPDLDAIGMAMGVPYGAPWGHRGATHALAMAAALGVVAALFARLTRLPVWRTGLAVGLVVASHGLLDSLTDGGRGVALLWPWSDDRFFAPWRPIPVAPIGLGLLTPRGMQVMASEVLCFAPLWVWALWRRGR